ncbi:MAG: hypothetical protein WBD07_03895 [Vicinamibacterales bacterium]
MKKRPNLITIDEDFVNIEKLLRALRERISEVAESVRIAASMKASARRRSRRRRP